MSSLDPSLQPYHFALLAYPRQYRYEHGAEMVDAAQELSGVPWSARESASFIVGGLRTRGLIASQQGPRSVWAAGMRVALLLMFVLFLAQFAAINMVTSGEVTFDNSRPWLHIITFVAICISLTITSRWPTALLVSAAWLGLTLANPSETSGTGFVILTIALAWWLALRTDGRRAMSPTAALSIFFGIVSVSVLLNHPYGDLPTLVVLCGPAVAGLGLITIDARPIVAAATTWLSIAFMALPSTLLVDEAIEWKYVAIPLSIIAFGIGLSRFSVKRVAGSGG